LSEALEALLEVRDRIYELMDGRAIEGDVIAAVRRAKRVVAALRRGQMWEGLSPRLALSLVEHVGELVEKIMRDLSSVEHNVRRGSLTRALHVLNEAEAVLAKLSLYMAAPTAAIRDLAVPLEATDVALECGSALAAEVYGFVARRGRVSRSTLTAAFAGREGLEEALSRLVSRGYLLMEEEGGELYYRVGKL